MRFFTKKSEPNSIKPAHGIQKQSFLRISGCPGAEKQPYPSSVYGIFTLLKQLLLRICTE
jgi:hypothetical protein